MTSSISTRRVPGSYWLAEYGDQFWPSIVCSDDMVLDHLIGTRPNDDVVPVLLMEKLEFIWARAATLIDFEPSNLSILADQPGNEELCQAYKAIEASGFADLDYWSDHLRDHLLAKSLRDFEGTDSQNAQRNSGKGAKRLYSSNEDLHGTLRATSKRKISDRAFGKMLREKACQLGLLDSFSDAGDDDKEEGDADHANADNAQDEEGSTGDSLEMDSEAEHDTAQSDSDIKNLEVVLRYATDNGESSSAPRSPDPNIVTIYVGNPGKGFQVPKEAVVEHRHLADCIVWDNDIGLRLHRRHESKIDPAHFFAVAEFFTFGDFEPRLIDRGMASARVEGFTTDSAKADAMKTCANVFRVARQMLLPYLLELVGEKFEFLRPWSAADVVTVAEIVLKKDCMDLEDEEDFRSVVIQHLASNLWDFDHDCQHRLRELMEADPYFAKALLGRVFSLNLAAHRDRKLRERADSGIGIESEKE